jgi:hypothetical protein
VATTVLRRHGLLHPANAYFHAPLLKEAAGGTLLTGFGGDQVLGRLRRPRRPSWWPRRAGTASPFPWLRPAADRSVRRGLRREDRARPATYDTRPAWVASRRDLQLTRQSLALLGHDSDTLVIHPLLAPEFVDALCHSGTSPEDSGGRAGLLRQIFAGVYPEEALRPRPKARFGEVFWRRHTRSVLETWDGAGINASVVDPYALRQQWDRPAPDLCTAMLVQQVWLAAASPMGGQAA